MPIDIDSIFARGGKKLIDLLDYGVRSVQPQISGSSDQLKCHLNRWQTPAPPSAPRRHSVSVCVM